MEKDNTALLNDIRQILNELKQQIACLEVKIDALSTGQKTPIEDEMIDLWMEETASAAASVSVLETATKEREVPETEPEKAVEPEPVIEQPITDEASIVEETPVDYEPADDTSDNESEDIELVSEEVSTQEPVVEEEPVVEVEEKVKIVFEEPSLESEEAKSPFCQSEPESSTVIGHVTDSVSERGCVAEPANQNPGEIAMGEIAEEKEPVTEPAKRFETLEEMFASFFGMPLPNGSSNSPEPILKPKKTILDAAQEKAAQEKAAQDITIQEKAAQEKTVLEKITPEAEPQIINEVPVPSYKSEPERVLFDSDSKYKSIADRLMGPAETWRTDIPGSPVKDIKSAISLNDRVMIIRNLFNNDAGAFQATATKINAMSSLDEAIDFLKETFPNWKWESEIVYKFMMAVRRKLN